ERSTRIVGHLNADERRLLADENVDAVDRVIVYTLLGPVLEELDTLVGRQFLHLGRLVAGYGVKRLDHQIAAMLAGDVPDQLVGLLDRVGAEELGVVLDLGRDGNRTGGSNQTRHQRNRQDKQHSTEKHGGTPSTREETQGSGPCALALCWHYGSTAPGRTEALWE